MKTPTTLAEVSYALGLSIRHGRIYDITCPVCGHESNSKDVHTSADERGFKCFVCGTWKPLSFFLGSKLPPASASKPLIQPKPQQAEEVPDLSAFIDFSPGYGEWYAYRRIPAEVVEKYNFRYGPLRFVRNSQPVWRGMYLIVPLYDDGKLVGLKGRKPEGGWIAATGSKIPVWGLEKDLQGQTVFVLENYADAALFEHVYGIPTLATGSVSNWSRKATERLKKAERVVVAFDNDLAGQANAKTRTALAAKWRAEHPGKKLPPPMGPRLVNRLRKAGVPAELFIWPDWCPAKYDMGDWLMEKLSKK